jgi:hypothetical protein
MYSLKIDDCAQTVYLIDDNNDVILEYSLCFLEYLDNLCRYLNLGLTSEDKRVIMLSESEGNNEKCELPITKVTGFH